MSPPVQTTAPVLTPSKASPTSVPTQTRSPTDGRDAALTPTPTVRPDTAAANVSAPSPAAPVTPANSKPCGEAPVAPAATKPATPDSAPPPVQTTAPVLAPSKASSRSRYRRRVEVLRTIATPHLRRLQRCGRIPPPPMSARRLRLRYPGESKPCGGTRHAGCNQTSDAGICAASGSNHGAGTHALEGIADLGTDAESKSRPTIEVRHSRRLQRCSRIPPPLVSALRRRRLRFPRRIAALRRHPSRRLQPNQRRRILRSPPVQTTAPVLTPSKALPPTPSRIAADDRGAALTPTPTVQPDTAAVSVQRSAAGGYGSPANRRPAETPVAPAATKPATPESVSPPVQTTAPVFTPSKASPTVRPDTAAANVSAPPPTAPVTPASRIAAEMAPVTPAATKPATPESVSPPVQTTAPVLTPSKASPITVPTPSPTVQPDPAAVSVGAPPPTKNLEAMPPAASPDSVSSTKDTGQPVRVQVSALSPVPVPASRRSPIEVSTKEPASAPPPIPTKATPPSSSPAAPPRSATQSTNSTAPWLRTSTPRTNVEQTSEVNANRKPLPELDAAAAEATAAAAAQPSTPTTPQAVRSTQSLLERRKAAVTSARRVLQDWLSGKGRVAARDSLQAAAKPAAAAG